MDSDDDDEQMFVSPLDEENAADAENEEHMMILSYMASLYADRNSKPQRGGSALGRRKGTSFFTLITSPMNRCTLRQYSDAGSG
jgi:hypothetical protein